MEVRRASDSAPTSIAVHVEVRTMFGASSIRPLRVDVVSTIMNHRGPLDHGRTTHYSLLDRRCTKAKGSRRLCFSPL